MNRLCAFLTTRTNCDLDRNIYLRLHQIGFSMRLRRQFPSFFIARPLGLFARIQFEAKGTHQEISKREQEVRVRPIVDMVNIVMVVEEPKPAELLQVTHARKVYGVMDADKEENQCRGGSHRRAGEPRVGSQEPAGC